MASGWCTLGRAAGRSPASVSAYAPETLQVATALLVNCLLVVIHTVPGKQGARGAGQIFQSNSLYHN